MAFKNQEKKDDLVKGSVVEALPATTFRINIEGKEVLCHLSGKMRMYHIKVYPGDTVMVKMSPDGSRGIITRRI